MNSFPTRVLGAALLLLASVCATMDASAQAAPRTFPTRTVRLIVGNEPGGGSDITGRLVALKLSQLWGQPVVVENRPGAGGLIAMNAVAQAPADGYTVMIMSNSSLSSIAVSNPEFDVQKVAPISTVNSQPYVLVVNQSLPVTSVQELVTYAKSRPGALNYGSTGTGSLPHMGMELFKKMTGTHIVHIPYKGAGPALAALMQDQIQVYFASTLAVSQHVGPNGRLRVLAMSGAERSSAEPAWPTMNESGLPGFELPVWYGMFTTAGTPASVVASINRDLNQVLSDPDLRARFARDGSTAWPGTPEQFKEVMFKEHEKWSRLARELKITP